MDQTRKDTISFDTRLIASVVILVLIGAFFSLYIFSSHTDLSFSWTIQPPSTAILIGAGYTAGIYFFIRVATEQKWHRVQAGFLPITAFTIFMFAATLLHWNKFHQGTFLFYLWTAIYIITPFLVPFLWWRNRASASTSLEVNDLYFILPIRWLLGIIAASGVLFGLLAFIQPALLIALSPWKLTELTARILSGWDILSSLTLLQIVRDGRWSSARILLQSAMIGLTLVLLSLPRIWKDLLPGSISSYLFIAGLTLGLVLLIAIHLWLDRLAQKK